MKNSFITLTAFLMLILFAQCTKEKANPVGSQYFQRADTGTERAVTLYPAATDTFYHTHVSSGARAYLHIGQQGETAAKTLIRFSSVPKGVQIDSARLTLYISQWLNETGDNLPVKASHILDAWSETSVKWSNWDASFVGDAAMEFTIPAGRSDSLQLKLPEALLAQWSDTSSASTNYGLFMESLTEGPMIQFYSYNSSYPPILTLYTKEDTVLQTLQYYPSSDTFIADAPVEGGTDYLKVSNGQPLDVHTRSLLYFELPELPEKATINGALLHLTPDTSQSQPNHTESFGIKAYPAADLSWPVPEVPYDSTLVATGVVDIDSTWIDVSAIIQNCIYGSLENKGFVVMNNHAATTFYERVFYSSSVPDSTRKPALTIYYSVPPVVSRF